MERFPESVMAEPSLRPFALVLAASFAVVAVLLPLVPQDFRLWNYAAFGAVGLFAAARIGRFGLVAGLLLALGAKLASDLLNYVQHGYDADYLPFTAPVYGASIYLGLALYAVLGLTVVRKSENPVRIGTTALVGGVCFFLLTNFASWIYLPMYPKTFGGLLEAYAQGLPFIRGTLLSDVTFTGVLFGLNAILERATTPRYASIPVEDTERS
jgi:hypothetical protein